jgi:glycine/D-amino acid oxidase-like deaminating enzyme
MIIFWTHKLLFRKALYPSQIPVTNNMGKNVDATPLSSSRFPGNHQDRDQDMNTDFLTTPESLFCSPLCYDETMDLKSNQHVFRSFPCAISNSGAYVPTSYWQETTSITPGSPLTGNQTCDVAIVGGGFTGLSVAYHLKRAKPDLDVVLIERGVVGHGASGRNGGFAMPLIGWDLLYTAQKLGDEDARTAFRLMYDAIEHLQRTVDEHRIDCDLEQTGYLLLNTCAAAETRSRKEVETARRLGFDHQWLSGEALHQHIRSDRFRSGVFDPHPCILNPAKLARGMKAVVENLGVRIYEQTPLERLTDVTPVRLDTPGGSLQARQVVLALNGYGASLGFLEARVLPIHTYIVLTEPLNDAQLRATGWGHKRTSLETARNFIHYFRLTADNRILFGGEDAQLYYGDTYRDRDPRIFDALKARFREYFPALAEVRFTHEWGGVLGVSLDMFPTFGVSGRHDSIFYAGAYSGHGVSLSNYAGAILAPQMLQAAGIPKAQAAADLPFFYNRKPMWLSPDPLRYLGMQVYRHALHAHDRWHQA